MGVNFIGAFNLIVFPWTDPEIKLYVEKGGLCQSVNLIWIGRKLESTRSFRFKACALLRHG